MVVFYYYISSGPPSEPAGVYIQSTSITETSVVIQWKAAGTNHQAILSYVIEAHNGWENFWRIMYTSEEDKINTFQMQGQTSQWISKTLKTLDLGC